jgi:hypothetical protein
VKTLKNLTILIVLGILIIAGCVSTPQAQPSQNQTVPKASCRNVTEQQPYITEVCNDIQVTKQVCGMRDIPYDYHKMTTINLCLSDGNCSGKPLGDCQVCTTAMTRCGIIITNNDKQASGAWGVAANFTVKGGGFNMNPVTKVIAPNESAEFDFQQMYTPGNPISSANCVVGLVSAPKVDDCHDETRIASECENVTKYKQVDKQVCE